MIRTERKLLKLLATLAVGLGTQSVTAQTMSGSAGDWQFASDATLATASTSNDQGASFGMVCTETCITFLAMGQSCRVGERYPVVLRGPSRGHSSESRCQYLEARHVLMMNPREDFIETLAGRGELKVSAQLDDGAPTEFRFSLNGAYESVYITLAMAMLLAEPASQSAPAQ